MTGRPQARTAFLLAICQACFLSASSIGVASSGLVGTELAPTLLLATLPYSLIATTNACVTVPASFLMARLAVDAGVLLLNGKKPAEQIQLMDSKLVTRDNVGDYKGWTSAH